MISLEHTRSAHIVPDGLSRSAALGQPRTDHPVEPGWEAGTGIKIDLYETVVRRITRAEATVLLQRFEGDKLEDIVRVLCNVEWRV